MPTDVRSLALVRTRRRPAVEPAVQPAVASMQGAEVATRRRVSPDITAGSSANLPWREPPDIVRQTAGYGGFGGFRRGSLLRCAGAPRCARSFRFYMPFYSNNPGGCSKVRRGKAYITAPGATRGFFLRSGGFRGQRDGAAALAAAIAVAMRRAGRSIVGALADRSEASSAVAMVTDSLAASSAIARPIICQREGGR